MQLDAAGQVVLTGCTSSRDFVGVSAGSNQPTYGGGYSDAVVCCLSADLTRLVWGTYLGGDQADAAYTLALAPGGAVYVGGGTGSGNFPAGGFAAEPAGGTDGFVSRYGPGGALQATARLGTRAHDEQVSLLALTETGDVLALGMAPGIQGRIPNPGLLPVTPGRYAVPGGNFLAQFSPDLQSRRFQTTFGATGFESTLDPVALGCDPCGNIYAALVGWAGYAGNYAGAIGFVPPAGLPTTAGSFPVRRRNFYAVRFSPGVRSLDEAWVLPGNHTHGTSRVAPDGRFYLAVCGTCDRDGTFQLLPGVNSYANIPANSNNCNDASLLVSFAPSPAGPLPPQVVCADAPAVLLGGFPAGGTWRGPGVSAAAEGYQFQPAPALVGVQTLAYEPPAAAPTGCATATTITQTFTVLTPSAVQFDPVLAAPFCTTAPPVGYYASELSARPPGGYFSGPGVNGNRFSPTEAGPGTHTLTYTLPGATGVCGTATQTVVVLGTRLQIGPRDTALCGADLRPFQLRASPPGGTWRGPGVTSGGWFDPALATGASPAFRNVVSLTYTYSGADGCRSEATLGVGVVNQVEPSVTLPPAPVCPLAPGINFYAPYTLSFPGFDEYAEYSWDFGDGSFSPGYIGPIPPQTHTYNLPGTYAPKLTVSYLGRCSRFVAYAPFTVGEASPLPNIITPNRDGLNETLVQRQFCQPPRLQVFSRWGQRVYQSAAYDNSWAADGLPAGTYFYLFEDAASPQRAKGWVEVVR